VETVLISMMKLKCVPSPAKCFCAAEAAGRSHLMRRDHARGAVAASVLAAHYARLSERCSPCRLLFLAGAFPLVERSASI
jgi:hypothetical protein